jgi:hypothetical protein
MTPPPEDAPTDDLTTNRRDLLKGLLLGGTPTVDSRTEALKSLVLGGAAAPVAVPDRPETGSEGEQRAGERSARQSSSPIPVRATESVSIRAIAGGTSGVSGPPYKLTEVAEERGLLNVSHPVNPREDPPFALRELITSQKIEHPSIANKTGGNATWRNWVGDHFRKNLTKFRPENKRELVDAIIANAREGERIRAVGSGHSHSKVAAPDLNFIELAWQNSNGKVDGLVDLLDKEWISGNVYTPPFYQPYDTSSVRVEAGATIKYLNRKLLLDEGYGLLNMGSFDAQTLAGAVNTSTHGTGARLGSLADSVRSVELVTVTESPAQPGKPLVRTYRIEPYDTITDREAFEKDVADHESTLIQDEDVFHSAVVGYGAMGVAYAYTVGVRDKYFLYEESRNVKWNDFKNDIPDLIDRGNTSKHFKEAEGGRHVQFRVNLAQLDARDNAPGNRNPRCLLISHRDRRRYATGVDYPYWPSKPGGWDASWPPERAKRGFQSDIRFLTNLAKGGTGLPPKTLLAYVPPAINSRFQTAANKAPFEEDLGDISTEVDPGGAESASFIALRRLRENKPDPHAVPDPPPDAISTEIAVPADQVVEAIEEVFDEVIDNKYAYHAPMGVRFVARSKHALSPEYTEDTVPARRPVAKIEVPFPVGQFKLVGADIENVSINEKEMRQFAEAALAKIEDRLLQMSRDGRIDFARPHMGKTNTITRSQLESFYENFDTWQAVHREFDAFGTFDNAFTRSKGIDIQ